VFGAATSYAAKIIESETGKTCTKGREKTHFSRVLLSENKPQLQPQGHGSGGEE
jgi:hypothetical protein